MLNLRRYFLLTSVGLLALPSYAADVVRLTYDPGYPLAGISQETMQLSIARDGADGRVHDVPVDEFFNHVNAGLDEVDDKPFCENFPVDFPRVKLRVELGGRIVSFDCAWSNTGAAISIASSQRANTTQARI